MRRAVVALMLVTVLWTWPAVAADAWFRFADPEIDESSGLVVDGDLAFTVNDSGDSARVFVVDTRSGETVGVTTYAEEVEDVEALALTPDGLLLVGDIGDNPGERDFIRIHSLDVPTAGDRTVVSTAYDLVYEDGPRDAETLLVHPRTGRVSIVTKGLLGGSVYQAPRELRTDRTNILQRVGSAPGLVTDGTYFPDGEHLLLRDYTSASVLSSSNFGGLARIPLPDQEQGEGIALRGDVIVLSSEGANAPVLLRQIPPRVLRALDPEPTEAPSPGAAPPVEPVPADDAELLDGPVVPVMLALAWAGLVGVVVARLLRRRA